MQSKRDQVQAYFFVVGRLVSAVVHGRPDVLQQPNKRLNTGTFIGVIVGAVLMGIFGIYGVFVPGGNTTWRQPGAIVMNETTGARYVYLDNQLRPVLNYSSARLVGGKSGNGQVFSVSQKSLTGTPVGQPIGIAGAPDALPPAAGLDSGAWTVCAQSPGTGPPATGPTVALLLGQPVDRALTEQQALLVESPGQPTYLVWRGKRHRIPSRSEAEALGYGGVDPMTVTAAWLNPLAQGRDIAVPRTPGLGQPGPVIDGRRSTIGQIYEIRNPAINTDQLYLVRSDGVAPLSRTSAALLLAAESTKAAYPGGRVSTVEAGPNALAGVPYSHSGPDLAAGLPPEPPRIANPAPDAMACASFPPPGKGDSNVVIGHLSATAGNAKAVPLATHPAGTTADRISVPAGKGVLARQLPLPGALFLVTETGTKYPLANSEVVAALGYSEPAAVQVPGELLGLLPSGPVLSVDAALRTPAPGR
ncbi:type VII secretion protein EccB [Actinosynnema sp. ALI-1.44]|uniref:type VII secretion protein EccB n=1 Tax=Actinosynnema sp. ALI-1.44 TaxID=1933779 RepID=UPI00097C5A1D|nr:type VII secretion protein EccB [Actinosynnema sp. ALI-1.44]ONI87839.1 type VII secretion protein EccB [Actinosynnema sp. ALI-1.44]